MTSLDITPLAPSEPGEDSPYRSYVYAYPHKTAYRPLPDRPRLREVWAGEPRDALSLYLHVPFCEMRCGFCNLFTRSTPPAEQVAAYLDALERQAEAVAEAIPGARYARGALGGGTPTYLTADELARLYDIAGRVLGADLAAIPTSVETSPATATPDRLDVLAEHGVSRVSIGVQSFIDAEAHAAGRPQRRAEVDRALDAIRARTDAALNIDLIYGIDGQTPRTWRYSLDTALEREPEELYLYPLYVRPLTGLGRRARDWDDHRLSLYRQGRDHLLDNGYRQVSMRMFERGDAPRAQGPDYCCQSDGMVGLGCGARSYTADLHYSFDYAVGVGAVRAILADYTARDRAGFERAEVGFRLDEGERRRRHLLQSLLRAEGVDPDLYRDRFASHPAADFPAEFAELAARGWLVPGSDAEGERPLLTAEGLAHSDAIGPLFFSPRVTASMAGYDAR
ncbi:STM4012 family radical SAM protein [Marinactinospora thermotolerans]|uniref:Heme chaperone HemW n=1 Tax=Marinactinospora thermotolerans DSM 45154 TaxID=1122192 RepID=A0A1T4TCA9_9ACTN|nr:STM4012 family radical SAM protein [Marinactinospora thermotolerans]SKA38037.1 coproporphyrinogen III oxidase, anaerobic [Marinactinospora thermotolerans DSM 45154]